MIITNSSRELLCKEQTENYGYGFYVSDEPIGHGGVFLEVGSIFTYELKTRHYVIVLSNYESMVGSVIAVYSPSIDPLVLPS